MVFNTLMIFSYLTKHIFYNLIKFTIKVINLSKLDLRSLNFNTF